MRKIPRIWSVQVTWKVKITSSGCVIRFVAWNILVACFFSTINRKKIHQTKFACFDFCKTFARCVLFSIRFLCCNSKSNYVLECGQLKCLFRWMLIEQNQNVSQTNIFQVIYKSIAFILAFGFGMGFSLAQCPKIPTKRKEKRQRHQSP